MRPSTKVYIAVILLLLATLLACMAVGSPTWLENHLPQNGTTHVSIGLWYACIDLDCVSVHENNGAIVKALGGESIRSANPSCNLHFGIISLGVSQENSSVENGEFV
jgi:hypothetical protein